MKHDIEYHLPSDWRKFHRENALAIAPDKRIAAVDFLRRTVADWPDMEELKQKALADPEWWMEYHFFGMMGVRNLLRQNGFGEKDLGVGNIDDYAVGLLELALGVTSE